MRLVLLGPTNELHSGIHASLTDDPPRGFRYQRSAAIHTFLFPKGTRLDSPLSPYRYSHWGEFLEFDAVADIVHTARFPVLGRPIWVTDMDDFGYPFLGGRFLWNPRSWRRKRSIQLAQFQAERARNMLVAYAHPSCKAVMFRTQAGIENARRWLQQIKAGSLGEIFLRKCRLLYPAQRPLPWREIRRKWDNLRRLKVLFCGNDFAVKNGALALEIFTKLRRDFPHVEFHYVGTVPPEMRIRHKDAIRKITYHPWMARRRLLQLFQQSHVFFHPSRNESFGMVYLEACAGGLAVITAKGGRMSHVTEIFETDGAVLIDREAVRPSAEPAAFETVLRHILDHPQEARRMGVANYERTTNGKFSIRWRNNRLSVLYREALAHPSRRGFSIEELPLWKRSVPMAMGSDDIKTDMVAFLREIGFQGFNLCL